MVVVLLSSLILQITFIFIIFIFPVRIQAQRLQVTNLKPYSWEAAGPGRAALRHGSLHPFTTRCCLSDRPATPHFKIDPSQQRLVASPLGRQALLRMTLAQRVGTCGRPCISPPFGVSCEAVSSLPLGLMKPWLMAAQPARPLVGSGQASETWVSREWALIHCTD